MRWTVKEARVFRKTKETSWRKISASSSRKMGVVLTHFSLHGSAAALGCTCCGQTRSTSTDEITETRRSETAGAASWQHRTQETRRLFFFFFPDTKRWTKWRQSFLGNSYLHHENVANKRNSTASRTQHLYQTTKLCFFFFRPLPRQQSYIDVASEASCPAAFPTGVPC